MRSRVLFCGTGHDAIRILAAELERAGWRVDQLSPPLPPQAVSGGWRVWHDVLPSSLPGTPAVQRIIRRVHRDMSIAAAASSWFTEIDAALARNAHDVVVAFLDLAPAPLGLARMIVRRHPRPILASLGALAHELTFGRGVYRYGLEAVREAARVRLAAPLHPDLFRPIAPAQIPPVVFATRSWRDEAVAAGLPPERGSVIPFGVPVSPRTWSNVPQPGSPAKLLWAGRLSPMKGLHLFLEALPLVAARRDVTLTVIAAPGPADYAEQIDRIVRTHHLEQFIHWRSPVPRAQLQTECRRHDLLLFHSVYAEPVAQVMLLGAVAGIPIVGPASDRPESLLRDGVTACCYDGLAPERVADAILRALDAGDGRTVRAARLYDEVRAGHDLDRTVESWDALLRARIGALSCPETACD